MQNAMLDSVVSSNSQELFDFNATHNGEACIESLDPKDRGTERRFRFTRALLCTLLGVKSQDTITNHVDKLLQRGVIEATKNLVTLKIPSQSGVQETTLYDLKVFNYLVMRLDTDQAWEKKAKFNDVLVERETGVKHETQAQPTIFDYARALIAEKERSDALEAQNKALEADLTSEKEAHEKDNEDFRNGLDIINAQKAQIVSTREATAMATASVKSRECKRLTAENAELKDAVGRGTNWHTVNMMTAEWKREFGHAPSWQKLKEYSADLPKEMKPVRDVEVKVVLRNGSEKVNKVFRYHRKAWEKYRESEENRRAQDKNVPDTKILGLKATDTEVEYF